jgi:hypothetical protein
MPRKSAQIHIGSNGAIHGEIKSGMVEQAKLRVLTEGADDPRGPRDSVEPDGTIGAETPRS